MEMEKKWRLVVRTREVVDLEKSVIANAVHVEFVPSPVIVALSRREHTSARAKVILAYHFAINHLNRQKVTSWSSHQKHQSLGSKSPEWELDRTLSRRTIVAFADDDVAWAAKFKALRSHFWQHIAPDTHKHTHTITHCQRHSTDAQNTGWPSKKFNSKQVE